MLPARWKHGLHAVNTVWFAIPGSTREAAARAAVEALHPFGVRYVEYCSRGAVQLLEVLTAQKTAARKLEAPQLPQAYVSWDVVSVGGGGCWRWRIARCTHARS